MVTAPIPVRKGKQDIEAKGIKWCVNRKGCRYRQMSPADAEYNHKQSQTRARGSMLSG